MRKALFPLAVALMAAPAAAQTTQMKPSPKPMTAKVRLSPADKLLAKTFGVWVGKGMVGKKDSVVVNYTVISSGTRDGWSTLFPNRDPLPTRVIAVGGDSVVTEVGPYQSITRPDQSATTRMTGHYHGNHMRGTFSAKFSDGGSLSGKLDAKRKK